MAETPKTSAVYGILLDRSAPRVLMLSDDADLWTLPNFTIPDQRIWLSQSDVVCAGMHPVFGADVTVLRNVFAADDANRTHADLIYVLENHTDNWTPPAQAHWITRDALQNLALLHPEQRTVIDGVLREVESGQIPELRPPWARPGWFQSASVWMRDQLTERGYTLTTPITQVRSWGISCLLRVSTDRGVVFFKVATQLPLFGNEPALLKALSERYPDFVPAPLAIEPEQRWMLMDDFGSELRSMPTLDLWEAAMRRFGQLQVQTASVTDDLFSIGCLDRRLDVLARQIDPLLHDEAVAALISVEEMNRLLALAPRLKAMCSELASYSIPFTLNHGDLHDGNITGETLRFFDWTDACIAYPFLDLCTVVMRVEKDLPGEQERVLDAYLSQWTDYAPIDQLRLMWRLAEPLGALHQAVSYQHILAILEPTSKQELAMGVTEWLQQLLKLMADEPA